MSLPEFSTSPVPYWCDRLEQELLLLPDSVWRTLRGATRRLGWLATRHWSLIGELEAYQIPWDIKIHAAQRVFWEFNPQVALQESRFQRAIPPAHLIAALNLLNLEWPIESMEAARANWLEALEAAQQNPDEFTIQVLQTAWEKIQNS